MYLSTENICKPIKTKLERTTRHIAHALTVAHIKVTSLQACIKPQNTHKVKERKKKKKHFYPYLYFLSMTAADTTKNCTRCTNGRNNSTRDSPEQLFCKSASQCCYSWTWRNFAPCDNRSPLPTGNMLSVWKLSLIHIWRCRRSYACRSRWSPYH